MRQPCRVACRSNATSLRLAAIALLFSAFITGCAKLDGPDDRMGLQEQDRSVCLNTDVALGTYRIPAFEKASMRVITAALADSSPVRNCTPASLQLHYKMAFVVTPFSWKAELLVTDVTGRVVWRGVLHGENDQRAALQYLVESTAVKLVKNSLVSP